VNSGASSAGKIAFRSSHSGRAIRRSDRVAAALGGSSGAANRAAVEAAPNLHLRRPARSKSHQPSAATSPVIRLEWERNSKSGRQARQRRRATRRHPPTPTPGPRTGRDDAPRGLGLHVGTRRSAATADAAPESGPSGRRAPRELHYRRVALRPRRPNCRDVHCGPDGAGPDTPRVSGQARRRLPDCDGRLQQDTASRFAARLARVSA
jgi:hypothetical protein